MITTRIFTESDTSFIPAMDIPGMVVVADSIRSAFI